MNVLGAIPTNVTVFRGYRAIGIGWLGIVLIVPRMVDPALELSQPGFPWTAAFLGGALSLAASFLGGVVPALRASRFELASALRE